MSDEPITLFQVGLPASRRGVLREAAEVAFPTTRTLHWVAANTLDEALAERRPGGIQLLVLDTPRAEETARALDALDAEGLPRWGVVLFAADATRPGVEAVGVDDLEARLVARALRSAQSALALRRDLARERGDVWTVGRRLTHDLRNPLGCIVTTAEMLKEVLASDAPEHMPFVDSILESTAETMDLLNRVHFMAKASAQPRPPELLAMDGVRQAAIDRLQREITARRAMVTGPEDWPDVPGVRPWLEVVWANLIGNALRHSGEPARVETGWRRGTAEWEFWVADRGPGVLPDRVEQLFTPFHQLHQRHGGGLGLSIVHRLLELQGGRCRYQPRPGGGAVFLFTLPLALPSNAPVSREQAHRGVSMPPELTAPDGLPAWASPAG